MKTQVLTKTDLSFWAKSPPDNKEVKKVKSHPVVAHLLDVAASAWEILELEPESTLELYSKDFGMPEEQVKPLVCALVGLHDLGKISPAFQQKWKEGLRYLLEQEPAFNWKVQDISPPKCPPKDVSHSLITEVVLPKLLETKGLKRKIRKQISKAIGCHHGYRALPSDLDKAGSNAEKGVGEWEKSRERVFNAIVDVLGVRNYPTIKELSPEGFMRLAGLTSFADWIGSSLYPELCFTDFETDLQGYFKKSQEHARNKLKRIGWPKRKVISSETSDYESIFAYLMKDGEVFKPRSLQCKVQSLLSNPTKPTLLIIEAPMGEGKTEAAFYAHLKLQASLKHRGLYVALPTMATGNAMFERTVAFLEAQAKDKEISVDLQLLHGATQLNELYQELKKISSNIDMSKPQTLEEKYQYVEAREYFTPRKRALLSEYGVGTIDQALLTVLNVKHQFVRLWGLGNKVVIIDEIHAYDTYTSKLITTLVQWLYALGSSVIIMSATLPEIKRNELLEAYNGTAKSDIPYPRIFRVSEGQTEAICFEADKERQISIELFPLDSDLDSIVKVLKTELKNGGCAVCIVNTVSRAQKLFEKLNSFEDRYLFHARFPADERSEIENKTLNLFGKEASLQNGKRPTKAVLVATQVVEQSLDLDFDLMVSDLAPIDLLIQRAGRMWRHKRANRPLKAARLYITGLKHDGELPELIEPELYWSKIYDPFILYKTWEVVKDKKSLILPNEIDELVQQVYNNQKLKIKLSQAALGIVDEAQDEQGKGFKTDVIDSEQAVISDWIDSGLKLKSATALQKLRDEDDKPNGKSMALTRKGEPSVTVIPIFKIDNKYFMDRKGKTPYDKVKSVEIFKRAVRISRKSLVAGSPNAIDKNTKEHAGDYFNDWEKDSLLRNCAALILNKDGIAEIANLRIVLDNTLGICYETITE